jgi:hypothetical protein
VACSFWPTSKPNICMPLATRAEESQCVKRSKIRPNYSVMEKRFEPGCFSAQPSRAAFQRHRFALRCDSGRISGQFVEWSPYRLAMLAGARRQVNMTARRPIPASYVQPTFALALVPTAEKLAARLGSLRWLRWVTPSAPMTPALSKLTGQSFESHL